MGYTQIINSNFQVMLLADVIAQQGYLGLPFHRVYFSDGSVHIEKLPVALRASYFLGDNVIIRAYYRYYTGDWKLTAHTADIEIRVKLTQSFSLSPFYRYYTQKATRYFNGYGMHTATDEFYTSNYDLSSFNSNFMGIGLKLTPPHGVLGIRHFDTVELRYGHYEKTTQMAADIITINIKCK